jgi:diadenosine tetraphosphate (Ap4A) HIT family hydrolase
MISLGTTCYLALPNQQELTPGSCLIVPIQHVTSTLDCDDDVWTEIRVRTGNKTVKLILY